MAETDADVFAEFFRRYEPACDCIGRELGHKSARRVDGIAVSVNLVCRDRSWEIRGRGVAIENWGCGWAQWHGQGELLQFGEGGSVSGASGGVMRENARSNRFTKTVSDKIVFVRTTCYTGPTDGRYSCEERWGSRQLGCL
jgi:hypothetical protein